MENQPLETIQSATQADLGSCGLPFFRTMARPVRAGHASIII